MRAVSVFSPSSAAFAKSAAISPPTVRPGYLPGWAASAEFATFFASAAVSTRLCRVVVVGPLTDAVHLHHRIRREARPRVACHAAWTLDRSSCSRSRRVEVPHVGPRSQRPCSRSSLSRTAMKAL